MVTTDIKLDLATKDVKLSLNNDFALVSDTEALQQAIVSRILTSKGELASHINYGSELYNLIGAAQTELTLNIAGAYVYQALSDEDRIKSIDNILVEYMTIDGKKNLIFFINVTTSEDVPLNLTVNYQI